MPNQFGHMLPQAQCFAKYFAGLLNEQELDNFETWIENYDEDRRLLAKMPSRHELKRSFEVLDAVDVEAACTVLQKKLFGGDRRYLWVVRSRMVQLAAAIFGLVLTAVLVFVLPRRGTTEKAKGVVSKRGTYIDPATIAASTNSCMTDHKVVLSSGGGVKILSSPECAILVDTEKGIVRVVNKKLNVPVTVKEKIQLKYAGSKTSDQQIGMIAGVRE